MEKTKIDWCDSTWNPVTGCLHGCEYCYARGIANRFGDMSITIDGFNIVSVDKDGKVGIEINNKQPDTPYPLKFTPALHRYRMDDYKTKRGRNIFVCSMADLFGEWVHEHWIEEVFNACKEAPQHNYLFLTKNPNRYIELELEKKLPWADNFWFGSSVTQLSDSYTWFSEKKFHWFLSVEPMLEDLGEMDPDSVKPEWIIVGAETGNRKNKVTPERKWIKSIVAECRKYGIPIFMKESLVPIWGDELIQEFPKELRKEKRHE